MSPDRNQTSESTADGAPPASPGRWRMLLLLMSLCFISHFNRASMASAGDERLMKQFGLEPEAMGWVYSAFLIVYTLFMVPGGLFIDRFGPRAALMLMGFGTGVFCAITGAVGWGVVAAAQVWVTLLVVRALMGFFTTPLHPGCARATANWFPPPQRALANGLVTGAALLAYALVHPVFGALIDLVEWQNAFLITGVCTGLLTGLWAALASDHPPKHSEQSYAEEQSADRAGDTPERRSTPPASRAASSSMKSPSLPSDLSAVVLLQADREGGRFSGFPIPSALSGVGSFLRDRNIILLTLSYAAVGYFQYLFFYWMHYYFDSILHMGKTESRFYAGLPNLAMAVAMPIGGWLTDLGQKRLGHGRGRTLVPRASMVVSAGLLLFGIFAKDTFWIVMWFTLSLGVLGLCEGAFWTTAVELGGKRGGTVAAIMNTGGNGIGLLAPILTPMISAKLGWTWGISLGALVGFLGAICWWWIVPREPASATPDS